MTPLTTLPNLPASHHWRRPITPEPRLAKWYAAPIKAPYLASTETGMPQAGDLVVVDRVTCLYLPGAK